MNYKILPKRGQRRQHKRRANQHDTIQAMRMVARESAREPYFKKLVKKYNLNGDRNSLERIFNFAFFNTYFQGDNPKIQTIRSGVRSIIDQRANCVDYSILLSSFLINMQVPHSFRMISIDPKHPNNFAHIYVILADGTVLDCVIGQDQTGKEYLKDRDERDPHFRFEAPYLRKSDLRVF